MNKLLKEIIYQLLYNSVPIELCLSPAGTLRYTIQTGAKSDLTLFSLYGDDFVRYQGRYEYIEGEVESFRDLLWVLKECRCGRDYMNENLTKLLVKEGILTKTVKELVEYK